MPSPWVVQSPADPSKSLGTLAHSLSRIKALSGTAAWSAHDLRHTLRSELSALGVGLEVKELILAHRLPGLVGAIWIWIVATACVARLPSEQFTMLLFREQLPWLGVEEMNVIFTGSVFVRSTPDAVLIPRFVTVMV